MKILIRATNWIGDAVMSLPAIRALRARHPEAHITVLAKPWVADLYEGESSIDKILTLEGASGWRDLRVKWRAAAKLRRQRFDLAVLFPNSFESAALAKLGGARRIVGYKRDGRGPLLTDAIPLPEPGALPAHETYYFLELLRRAGLTSETGEVREVLFDQIPEKRALGESMFKLLQIQLPVVGVSPGAAYGKAKRWLPERFAEAAARLAGESDGTVVVFGSAAEKELCDEVARLVGARLPERPSGAARARSFAGQTALRGFIELAAACRVFLTNDSGAMHIAAALGVPSVTVFGPTDEKATGPLGARAAVVREPLQSPGMECAPCLKRECPIDHRCMTRVTVDQVVAAAGKVISSEARKGMVDPR